MSSKSKTSRAKSTAVLSTMVLLGICVAINAKYSGGTGEPNNPYRIATAEDLNDIGNYEEDWDKHFILVNDVNLAQYTGMQFNIIGNSTKRFTGFFDGNDHKVLNFTWNSIDYYSRNIGLFGYVGYGGQIKNLGMENVDVNAPNMYVGGLVGDNDGTITKCYASGSVAGWDCVGVLVGANYGITTNCYSTGRLWGHWFVGGLVGWGTATDCYSTSCVTGDRHVGGLVGYSFGAITNCYSTGSVIGDQEIGGLIGTYGGTIVNCYSTGNVNGNAIVGGLMGANYGMTTACYFTGSVTGNWQVGGLVGGNVGTITDCYSAGSVVGYGIVGGLVGGNEGIITVCYSAGSVDGNNYVGGLVGRNYEGTVSDSFWDIRTSDCNTSAGGTPKTTSEMKTINTFTEAGWDFVEIWGIGENQTYPYLRFAPAGDFNYDKKVDFFDLAILAAHWLESPP